MKDPKAEAEKVAKRMKETWRKGGRMLPEPAIGRMVLKLLKDSDTVSFDELMDAFKRSLDAAEQQDGIGAQMTAGEAEGAIRTLRSLRSPEAEA